MKPRRYIPIGIALVVVIGIQALTAATETPYYLTQLTMAAYYALVVVGLCLVMGYAGQISIGHAGFFAIGGYGSAVITTQNLASHLDHPFVGLLDSLHLLVHGTDLYGDQVVYASPWLAFLLALLVTLVIATLIGMPILRLKGHYLAMATLGFGIVIYSIVKGYPIFGEADGISRVPPFVLVPGLAVNGAFDQRITNYYIAWGLVLIGLTLLVNLVNSRVGRALRAIHGTEDAAAAMGVNVAHYKLGAFVLSALYAATAGAFLTHYNGGIGPGEASIMKSVRYVAIVAVGGMANLWGALIMAVLLNFMSLRGMFGSYDDAVFGVILIIIMLFAPDGIVDRRSLHRCLKLLQPLTRRLPFARRLGLASRPEEARQ